MILAARVAAVALAALPLCDPARADPFAFVTAQEADTLAVVDLGEGKVTCLAQIGGRPAAVAVDPAAGLGYAVSTEPGRISAVAPDCRILWQLALEGAPFGLALNPARKVAYVSDWYGARLFEIDLGTQAVARSLATGHAPAGIAVTPDGARLITADRDDNRISLLDAATGVILSQVPVGAHPFGVTLSGGLAFTADVESDSVTVVDLTRARVIATIPVGKRPYAIAFAAGKGFVTNQYADTVSVLDAADFRDLGTVAVGEYPEGIAATADGRRIVVANWFSNSLTVIDSASLDVIAEIPVPDGPRAFGPFLLP